MDIYESFSNLNYRFKQLLNCSSLLFKIKLEYSMYNKKVVKNYTEIYRFNRHKIISIDLWLSPFTNNYFSLFSFDSSFTRLHTIVAKQLQSTIVILFLTNLSSLPRLSSLTIGINDNFKDLNEIYRLIFSLPTLKYNKLTLFREEILTPVSIIGNKQLSNIEQLIIDHCCTSNELSSLLSNTPQLRYLSYMDTFNTDETIENMLPMTLSNLRYISLHIFSATFDEFEIFIQNIYSKLKVLRLNILSEDIAYLDANRWENFLLQYLPQLKEFYLRYDLMIAKGYDGPVYDGEPNQFNSSFWIEHR
jgi:hypothetical protein